MNLYHATTPKKAKMYRLSGQINKPVRGFTTLQAAMLWSLSIEGSRTVFLEINSQETISENNIHKLPDHHNQFGEAWWIDELYMRIKCKIAHTFHKRAYGHNLRKSRVPGMNLN